MGRGGELLGGRWFASRLSTGCPHPCSELRSQSILRVCVYGIYYRLHWVHFKPYNCIAGASAVAAAAAAGCSRHQSGVSRASVWMIDALTWVHSSTCTCLCDRPCSRPVSPPPCSRTTRSSAAASRRSDWRMRSSSR